MKLNESDDEKLTAVQVFPLLNMKKRKVDNFLALKRKRCQYSGKSGKLDQFLLMSQYKMPMKYHMIQSLVKMMRLKQFKWLKQIVLLLNIFLVLRKMKFSDYACIKNLQMSIIFLDDIILFQCATQLINTYFLERCCFISKINHKTCSIY